MRTAAEDALLSAAAHDSFGVQLCLNCITRVVPPAASKDAKKVMTSNKHIIGKYAVLQKMLQS